MTEFVRKPSGLEAFFIDLDACGCNMTFHYFLKLDRQPDLEQLNDALRQALDTHGGINLKYHKNRWYKAEYTPRCIEIPMDSEDVYSCSVSRLDYRRNTVDLNVLHHEQKDLWYLCFDFFHGAVDGRSGLQFIYDFFHILKGDYDAQNSFHLTDMDIIGEKDAPRHHCKKTRIPLFPRCNPKNWLPRKKGEHKTIVMTTNACVKASAAKLASAVAKCFTSRSAKMIIPVDIRRYAKKTGNFLFGNLIAPIFVDANTIRKIDDVRTEIRDFVKSKPLLTAIISKLNIYSKIPHWLRKLVIGLLVPLVMRSRRFICCALVSPIGTIDSKQIENTSFEVEDIAVTFVSFPFTAFTVTSVQFNGHTNTTVSWHTGRVPQHTVANLIENIDYNISENN